MTRNAFEGVMVHRDAPVDDSKKLSFSVSRVIDNVLRLFVKELKPIRERFQINDVLSENARAALDFSKVRQDANGSTLSWNDKYECSIQYRPFRMVVSNNGREEVVANDLDSFFFEPYRVRTATDADCDDEDGDGDCPPAPEEEDGSLWEERFSSHTLHHDHGPASIGMDFTFVGQHSVFGIPEHAASLSLATTTGDGAKYAEPFRLWNLDVFEYKLNVPDALYGAIPYAVAYGKDSANAVFWGNAAETFVDVGEGPAGGKNVRWMSESGAFEAFLILHDHREHGEQYLAQYYALSGQPQLPPIFALGHHQCRWNYNDVDDVKAISDKFDELDIPNDFIWLDIEHTAGKRYFTFDPHKFGGAEEMIQYVAASGRKMVTIVDPHIKKDDGYYVYADIEAMDLWTKNRDNEPYTGWCWPGDSRYPDFANQRMREYWAEQFSFEKYKGSTEDLFIWNDMNEPSVFNGPEVSMPISNIHRVDGREVRHSELHNLYGLYVHEATFNGLLQRSGHKKLRPFVLSRSFFAGSQRFGAIWTGDNTANWDHLAVSVPMLLGMSIAGLPFVGADVGGFFNNPDGELMARWYELGAYYPFFRNHAHQDTERRELWLFGDAEAQRMKNAVLARYRILPYIYTLFFLSSTRSQLIMRPLWFGPFRGDEAAYGREDAFMLGPAFYIQPVVRPQTSDVEVDLPQNEGGNALFYEVNGNEMNILKSGKHRLTDYQQRIPVLRYGGTVTVEKHRVRRSASLMKHDPVTIVVALDAESAAEGDHFMDDEESLNGEFIWTKLKYSDRTLRNEVVEQSERRESVPRLEVERVVIMGQDIHQKGIREIVIEQGLSSRSTKQFGTGSHTLVVRLPGVVINQPFAIRLT